MRREINNRFITLSKIAGRKSETKRGEGKEKGKFSIRSQHRVRRARHRLQNLEISCPRVSIMEQTLPPRNCRCKQRFSSWLYTELKALLRTRSNERGGCLACHFRNANICALIVSFEYPFFPLLSLSLSLSVSFYHEGRGRGGGGVIGDTYLVDET